MNTSTALLPTALLPAVVRPAVEDRCWLSSDGCAAPVLDLLDTLGWAAVDTPEANVHSTSPDGRVYVGWLPEDPAAWKAASSGRSGYTPPKATRGPRSSAPTPLPKPSPVSSLPSSPNAEG